MNEPVITSFDIDTVPVRTEPAIRRQVEPEQAFSKGSVRAPEQGDRFRLISGTLPGMAILLATIFGAVKLIDPGTLPIRNVGVAGEFNHLSPARLQDRVSDIVRGGFFSVNVERIQQALLEEPWIRDVSVKRAWPDRIIVTIREQIAVAQWGEDALLNEAGDIFRPDRSSFPSALPVIHGPESSGRFVLNTLERIRSILPPGMSVRRLVLNERRSWEMQLDSGPLIRLGKTGIVTRLRRLLEHLPAEGFGSMAQIEYIDMRYTNGFALSRKPQSNADREATQENYGEEI